MRVRKCPECGKSLSYIIRYALRMGLSARRYMKYANRKGRENDELKDKLKALQKADKETTKKN